MTTLFGSCVKKMWYCANKRDTHFIFPQFCIIWKLSVTVCWLAIWSRPGGWRGTDQMVMFKDDWVFSNNLINKVAKTEFGSRVFSCTGSWGPSFVRMRVRILAWMIRMSVTLNKSLDFIIWQDDKPTPRKCRACTVAQNLHWTRIYFDKTKFKWEIVY